MATVLVLRIVREPRLHACAHGGVELSLKPRIDRFDGAQWIVRQVFVSDVDESIVAVSGSHLLAALQGANRDYILNHVPHISRLMVETIDELLAHSGTVVIGNAAPEFADVPARLREGQTLIDLVRICDSRSVAGVYDGICW